MKRNAVMSDGGHQSQNSRPTKRQRTSEWPSMSGLLTSLAPSSWLSNHRHEESSKADPSTSSTNSSQLDSSTAPSSLQPDSTPSNLSVLSPRLPATSAAAAPPIAPSSTQAPTNHLINNSIFAANRKSSNKFKAAHRLNELQQQDKSWRAAHPSNSSFHAPSADLSFNTTMNSNSSSTVDGSKRHTDFASYASLCAAAHAQVSAHLSTMPQLRRSSAARRPSHSLSTPRSANNTSLALRSKEFQRILNTAALSKNTPRPLDIESLALEKLALDRQKEAQKAQQVLVRKRAFRDQLPDDVAAHVKALYKQRGTISEMPGASVSSQDLVRLKPKQWLNDELVNFYMVMLNRRSNEHQKALAKDPARSKAYKPSQQEPLNIHAFTTFFFEKFRNAGHKGVARWTKKVDVFTKDAVLVPINLNQNHWVSACINLRKKRFEFYDSMGSWNDDIIEALRTWLVQEHEDKKGSGIDISDWEDYQDPTTPQQNNAFDCGMFVSHVMEVCSRRDAPMDFEQTNMPYLRQKMAWEIANKQFLDEDWA